MKFLYYIKYFNYIARNWNVSLAVFTIYHEIRGENKYHINTTKLNDLHSITVTGENLHLAEKYQGASYYLLEKIFKHLKKINVDGSFIDVGCGKGRVMVVAAHYGFKKITGIDFVKELCEEATQNCLQITQKFPGTYWEVIYANAAYFTFEKEPTVFFFFNPFKEIVMKKVVDNILESIQKYPRKVFIIYVNPQYKQAFLEKAFTESFYLKRMQFVDACIYEKDL